MGCAGSKAVEKDDGPMADSRSEEAGKGKDEPATAAAGGDDGGQQRTGPKIAEGNTASMRGRGDIFDHYEFKDELGRGAFSIVKLAVHQASGERVAVKVIDKTKMSPDYKKNLQMETDILRKVDHPHIIRMLEIYETDEYLFLVMELVTGGELFDKIVEKGCYTEKEAAELIKKIVSAIDYLHDQDICHRDLKPENLLLASPDKDTDVKIADFGLSKIIKVQIMMQTACGTPGYVAPEVLNANGYDKEVDMWSIGVICYILLCGFPPFFGDTVPELFEQIMKAAYDYPADYWDEVSDQAKSFIDALLVVNPEERMTTKQALAHPWLVDVQSDVELTVGTKLKQYVVDHKKDVSPTITKDKLDF